MPKDTIARDVAVVLAVKLALAIAAAVFVFGPSQRPRIDAGGMETRLMGVSDPFRLSGTTSP